MRGLSGLALALAGGVTAFYGLYPTLPERQDALDSVASLAGQWSFARDAATAGDAYPLGSSQETVPAVVDPTRRVFSPQAPLFQPQSQQFAVASGAHGPVTTVNSQPVVTPVADGTALVTSPVRTAEGVPAGPRSTAVAAPADQHAIPSPVRFAASTKAIDDDAQRALARSLQTELKRVGCYDGELHGAWTASSKRAMKSFIDRVNASLPVDEPDYILLTLVQGHAAIACGDTCPSNQVLASDGRCLPRAIVAQAAKKANRIAAQQKRPEADRRADSRMRTATAAQQDEAANGAAAKGNTKSLATVNAGWRTTTIAAVPTSSAAAAAAAPTAAAAPLVTSPAAVVTPLPGRMAIGGPVAGVGVAAPPVTSLSTAKSGPALAAAGAPDALAGDDAADRPPSVAAEDQRGLAQAHKGGVSEGRRVRPSRPRPSYAGADYAPRPSSSKSARIRAMHYNLFNNPYRTTN